MADLLMGIDIGTTAVKVILISGEGRIVMKPVGFPPHKLRRLFSQSQQRAIRKRA